MTTVETLVVIILAMISLPFLCNLIRRPSLLYSAYLFIGLGLKGLLETDTQFMIDELGEIGFILLLFQIGLEIDLSSLKNIKKYILFPFLWLSIQIPLLSFACFAFSWSWQAGFTAAAGLNACSLGISYSLLQGQTKILDRETKRGLLVQMILLEIFSLFTLAMSDSLFQYGIRKEVLFHALFLVGFIALIRLSSGFVHHHLSNLIETAGKWKLHLVLLTIFAVVMIGERCGLSGPKTAFFLGLFMISTSRNGVRFEDELKPIAKRILIPFFFISLGSKILVMRLFPMLFPIAVLVASILLLIRWILFQKFSKLPGAPWKYFLLYCPNLTMVGVAVEILSRNHAKQEEIDLLLAAGFLLTVGAALFFPSPKEGKESLLQPSLEPSPNLLA